MPCLGSKLTFRRGLPGPSSWYIETWVICGLPEPTTRDRSSETGCPASTAEAVSTR